MEEPTYLPCLSRDRLSQLIIGAVEMHHTVAIKVPENSGTLSQVLQPEHHILNSFQGDDEDILDQRSLLGSRL